MLSVAIDATPLLGERTGIGVAVSGLVTELSHRGEVALTGYGLTTKGWRRLPASLPDGVHSGRGPMPASALLRVWARSDTPPIEWWSGAVDVVHGTNFVVPPARRARRVVTVWDTTAVRFPAMCTPVAKRYPQLIARAVAAGAWIHTGAQAIAEEILDFYGVSPERVRVVPPGVTPPARPVPGRPPDRPYLLALGTTEPRKDLPTLVRAFALVAGPRADLELRIVGPAGWAEAQVVAAIAASPFRDRIHRMGWVEDVNRVLSDAALVAYPSVYEGFGLPPLEAMALGVPVVATAVGSIPEVVGDAAELVPPGDAGALAAAIDRVLGDADVRRRLVERGRARSAAFTWDAAGDGMVKLYQDVAADG